MKMNFKTLIITAIFCILTKEISSQYDYSNSNSYVATNDNTSNSYQNLPDYYQPEAKDQNYDDDVMKKVLNKYNKEVRPNKMLGLFIAFVELFQRPPQNYLFCGDRVYAILLN